MDRVEPGGQRIAPPHTHRIVALKASLPFSRRILAASSESWSSTRARLILHAIRNEKPNLAATKLEENRLIPVSLGAQDFVRVFPDSIGSRLDSGDQASQLGIAGRREVGRPGHLAEALEPRNDEPSAVSVARLALNGSRGCRPHRAHQSAKCRRRLELHGNSAVYHIGG